MKSLISSVIAVIVFFGLTGCSQETNPFVGSWKLVSQKLIFSDTTITADASTLQSMKILSQTHFAYVTDKTHQDSTIFLRAGAGTYTHSDKEYAEKIEYSSDPVMLGKTYRFSFEMEGDTWTHIGDIEDYDVRIEEVWRRTQ